ncbi:hypothetical protein [Eubacterium sp.]
MNMHTLYKIKTTFFDVLLALFLFLFFVLAVASPTIGNSDFYGKFLGGEDITQAIQTSLYEKTDEIAEETGIEPKAFEYAVGKNKIKALQKEIVKSAFSGGNYDYSESSNIAVCYRDGIKEFYRFNGFELDEKALEEAVPLASKAFNEAMGIDNNAEFSTFVGRLGRVAVMIVVAIFALIAACAVKVFMLNDGRTKMFSHYASSMISAGLSLVAVCVLNFALQFAPNMYLTENDGLNIALGQAFNVYFIILACFGAVLLVGGYSMMIYVYRYYVRKAHHQKQEIEINKTLYVGSENGDKTIGEIAKEHEEMYNKQEKK